MADRHRIGTFSSVGRFSSTVDLVDSTGNFLFARDTFTIIPPQQSNIASRTARRFGGSKRIGELHDNGGIEFELYVSATTADLALAKVDQLLAPLEDSRTQYYYEFRPDSATYSTYFEIRTAEWRPLYKWTEFAGARLFHVGVQLGVAPLALGDPLDITDTFSASNLTDYTFDALTSSDVTITGGVVTPSGASNASERRARFTARGYTYTDAQATIKTTPGSTITGFKAGVILRAVSATTYLEMYVDDDGSNGRIRIDKVVAGVRTNLVSSLTTRPVNGSPFWVRGRIEGTNVMTDQFVTEPTPKVSTYGSVSYVLTTAEQAIFTAGLAGWSWIPQASGSTLDDFIVEPYTYSAMYQAGRILPDTINLKAIPGTAPAKSDVMIGVSGAIQQVWGLISWVGQPATHNLVWNGDFEDSTIGTSGWSVGATDLTWGATSITRVTTAAKYGTASAQIVTPGGHVNEGPTFRLYRKFRGGVTYTASAWVRSAAAVTAVGIALGDNSQSARGTDVALSTSWQQITTTFTPSADMNTLVVAINTAASAAITFQVDGVQVYEGTVAPTVGKHTEGKGAYPPFGLLQAESAIPSSLSNWAITVGANASGGYYLAPSSATTFSAEWFIDPNLLVSDEFSDEISVEVYLRGALYAAATSVSAVLSAIPENNLAQRIYTEWGSTGRNLTLPTSGAANRVNRLGSLSFPIDVANSSRWRLKLTLTLGTASLYDFDYLLLVPTRQRAAGPTGKPNDSSYPAFYHTPGAEESKIIRSDLSGLYRAPPGPFSRDSGLSGQLIELPPGDVQALVRLGDLVPDDPTVNTTSENNSLPQAAIHFAVWPRYFLTRSG